MPSTSSSGDTARDSAAAATGGDSTPTGTSAKAKGGGTGVSRLQHGGTGNEQVNGDDCSFGDDVRGLSVRNSDGHSGRGGSPPELHDDGGGAPSG